MSGAVSPKTEYQRLGKLGLGCAASASFRMAGWDILQQTVGNQLPMGGTGEQRIKHQIWGTQDWKRTFCSLRWPWIWTILPNRTNCKTLDYWRTVRPLVAICDHFEYHTQTVKRPKIRGKIVSKSRDESLGTERPAAKELQEWGQTPLIGCVPKL